MTFDIKVGKYQLNAIESVTIKRSVETLSDTAVIVLPGTVSNRTLKIEEEVKYGDPVNIQLGYGAELNPEFSGYLTNVITDGGSITLECEDDFFLYRKDLKNEELNDKSLKEILELVNNQMVQGTDKQLKLDCKYDVKFKKFVIQDMTGRDLLKRIQNKLRPYIYLKDNTLYVHSHFQEVSKKLPYDFSRNIEAADLKYRKDNEKELKVVVEMNNENGKIIGGKEKKTDKWKEGNEKIILSLSGLDEASLQKIADEEFNRQIYTGYEGYIQTWLIPFCEPGYAATIKDEENKYAEGTFYVTSVDVYFSRSGGVRKITLGKKIEQ